MPIESKIVPWQMLGDLRDEYQAKLNEILSQGGCNERSASLSVVFYVSKVDDPSVINEFRLSGSDFDVCSICNDDATELVDGVPDPSELPSFHDDLNDMANNLNAQLSKIVPVGYTFTGGVQTQTYSLNVGYSSCPVGPVCIQDSINGNWTKWYYINRRGRCRWFHAGPC